MVSHAADNFAWPIYTQTTRAAAADAARQARERALALRCVARHARDAADAELLVEMLGLLEEPE